MYKNSKFAFFIALAGFIALSSCNTPKTGFFQNRYENYQAIKSPASDADHVVYTSNTSEAKLILEKSFPDKEDAINSDVKNISSHNIFSKEPVKMEVGKLTKDEKKQIKNDIRETLKKAKENETEVNTLLLVIIAILLPPVAVALVDGITGPFWLSILLTLLLYLPGLIYALYRIFRQS